MLLRPEHKTPPRAAVQVHDHVVTRLEEGIGVAFDIGNLAGTDSQGCLPALDDGDGWERLLSSLSYLSPAWIRVRIPGDLIMPRRGEVDERGEIVTRLQRIHDCAEQLDISVEVDLHPVPAWLASESGTGGPPAPSDLRVYVEDYFCRVFEFFLNEKRFRQIRYTSCFNEPFNEDAGEFTFGTCAGVDPYAHFVAMYRTCREQLANRGLQLKLVGPTSHDLYLRLPEKLDELGLDLRGCVDALDTHAYRFRFDYLPATSHVPTITLSELIDDYIRPAVSYAERAGKPYFITEYGCMYYGKSNYGDNRGPGRHEALIHETELLVRCLNAGVKGMLRWAYLFNPRETHGFYQMLNSFDGSYARQDSYHVYANLCRHVCKHSDVLASTLSHDETEFQFLHAAALRNGKGEVTMVLVNDHPAEIFDVDISIESPACGTRFSRFVTDFKDKYAEKADVTVRESGIGTRVMPMSLTVLTQCCNTRPQ